MTEYWRAELRPHNVCVMRLHPSETITKSGVRAGSQAAPTNANRKLAASKIAQMVHAMLSMHVVGFITEASV